MKDNTPPSSNIPKFVPYILTFNAISIALFFVFSSSETSEQNSLQLNTMIEEVPLEFVNKSLAYDVLSAFDIFEPVPEEHHSYRKKHSTYDKPFLGLKSDPEYCQKHRAYFVEHPEIVFEQKNFLIEVSPNAFLRRQARAIGNDVMPKVGMHMSKENKKSFLYDIDPRVTQYFTVKGLDKYKHVGLHFACLSQEHNHIPGHWSLNRKDSIAEGAIQYVKKFKGKTNCFNFKKYFPKTWLLHDTESCQDFFSRVAQPKHKELMAERKIVYIKKVAVGAHRGSGVTPLYEEEEQKLLEKYRYGELCGMLEKAIIVQKFINNPLLVEGRKFDFRMYMVIASTNPLMVYYHDGYLRVSLCQYDPNSKEKKCLLTNLALNNDLMKDASQGNLHGYSSQEEIQNSQQWTFNELQQYLYKTKKIDDLNWLDSYLRPEFKRAYGHLVRMSAHTFLERSQLYEFYGVDFMLDDDLTLWFIEANSGPAFSSKYKKDLDKILSKMLKDHFDLVHRLLKSRMKRIVAFVNRIIQTNQVKANDDGKVEIENMETLREEFKKISQNYFEPEYELPPDNGWQKVLDYNLKGKDRFAGLLDENCVEIE